MPSQPPKDWITKPLAEAVTFQKGKTARSFCDPETPGARPYLLISDFLSAQPGRFTEQDNLPKCSPSDTLVAWDGATAGKCATGFSGAIGSTVMALKPRRELLTPRFLYWWFHHLFPRLNESKRGAGVPHLSSEFVGGLQIPLPPLGEQNRLTQILDEADRLRRARTTADERTSQLTQAIFLEMFGDPGTNPNGLPTSTLGDLAGAGQYGLNAGALPEGSIGVRFIRITDFDEFGRLGRAEPAYVSADTPNLENYELEEGDILIARSGATAGKSYLHKPLQFRAVFASYLIRFKIDRLKALPIFVAVFLQTQEYWRQLNSHKRGVAQPNVNAKQLASIHLPVPPLDLQRTFAARVAEVQRLESTQVESRQLLDQLFDSLLATTFAVGVAT